ncbi:DUF2851 family protein, partial [bacterium]|nr:DUF2851 family protein [bacterium]
MIIPEELIQFIWANQLFQNETLRTDEGDLIQVLHQGIWNKLGSGPDFKDARLKIGDYTLAGAVEIHLNAGDWLKHSHQKDEAYNQVVLHVTYNGKDMPLRNDGSRIPNLELSQFISDRLLLQYFELMNSQPQLPCAFKI